MLLLWFLFLLIFFIYEIKKHINYFIALCSFQNDKFEKSAAPFESCKFHPLHEHLRSGTLNNLWEDFFSASGISFIFVPAIHEKDTKTQRENMWAPGEILLFLCSGVLDSKLPILGLFESLNFPVPRTVTWFPQTIKKTGKHDKKQVFREVLNPGVLCVFFPLFSSLDFVYCKIQRQFWIYSSSRTESFPLKCSQVQKMS